MLKSLITAWRKFWAGLETQCRTNSNRFHWNSGFRQSGTICQRWSHTDRHARRYLFVRRDLLVFTFWSCAICWAHAPRSCGKTGRGTSVRATEECSRPGACDRALAVDVGCRSSEAPANSARTAIDNPPLLHKIQRRCTSTSEAIHVRSRRSNCNCWGDRNRHLSVSTSAIFR